MRKLFDLINKIFIRILESGAVGSNIRKQAGCAIYSQNKTLQKTNSVGIAGKREKIGTVVKEVKLSNAHMIHIG